MQLAIYADLPSNLKRNDKIIITDEEEYERVIDLLKENNISYEVKSKKEIQIVPADRK
jgi:flagellar biosynthesis/type III secretory pathway M-ring protein FliF/YscJ